MTGVLEGAAVLAAVGAFGHHKHEQSRSEHREATQLYESFFHADLLECSPDRSSLLEGSLPAGVDPHAKASIKIIETYQKDRKQWLLGILPSSTERSGDVRTRILEEMKQWLATLVEGEVSPQEVTTRLDYFRQLLFRQSVFGGSNQFSFLNVVAEVCRQLEELFKDAISAQRNGATKLERMIRLGREIVHGMLPSLIFALLEERAVPTRGGGGSGPPVAVDAADLCAVAARAEGDTDTAWDITDAGRLLWALLRTEHARALAISDEAALKREVPGGGGTTSSSATVDGAQPEKPGSSGFAALVARTRERWEAPQPELEGSGLLPAFRQPHLGEARRAYLDVCWHLDRLAFFIGALRPYHRLACIAGDLAMCQLHATLGHLLQELETALVQLRQARLELMRAAKRRLQDAAKRVAEASPAEIRWMQGLRHIEELHLDELHRALVALCADVRAEASLTRASELHATARQELADVAQRMLSGDFQARCGLALPENVAVEMRTLRAIGAGSNAPRALSPAPQALTA